jgi:hypothetical protein
MKSKKSAFWFWAWIVLATYRLKQSKSNPRCIIWKNLIIVSGLDEQAAYKNACRIGKNSESKPSDRLTMDGKPAKMRFLGIAEMGVIHDPLEDGCELYFHETRSSLSVAKQVVNPKEKIVKSLGKELGPYKRNDWNPHDPKHKRA